MASAFEILGFQFTLVASVSLATNQFHAVVIDANGEAALAGAGGRVDAILQDKPGAGESGSCANSGITKMAFGAATAAGLQVAADATGRAVAAGAADFVIGTARVGAGAAGEIGSVLLTPGAQLNP